MQNKALYNTYKEFNLPEIEKAIGEFWEKEGIFKASIETRNGHPPFTFYEGPPSANGVPGIHHVLSRTLKDIFCRFKTLKGFQVQRKAGWDTHGLPIELQVEKTLGITKKDVGTKISIADYNAACRKDVMKFKDKWDELTTRMGYWLDLEHPYITFENNYIESVWHLLKRLYDKELLYKGYTIQPYSPAAGTGLSSHELNMPDCYKLVKDTSCVAQFKAHGYDNLYFLAWTTTPWTLPANSALAMGKDIVYLTVLTFNPYTGVEQQVVIAKALLNKYFLPEAENLPFTFKVGDKMLPYKILDEKKGSEWANTRYEQLLPYISPKGDAFRVILGDFVSTEDGTGIVHIAPTFGSDDFKVAKQQNIVAITVLDENGIEAPIVDKQGKFVAEMGQFAGRYVKDYANETNYQSVDIDICILLKKENKAFKVEKYEHNYPHCWRTDKPVLYYPLDSWFIKTSAMRQRMVEKNKEINWKPESTGSGRFGNWLENAVDWNLSRSRYWGVPLPIWSNENKTERKCIGSIAELQLEIDKAILNGQMKTNPVAELQEKFDLHKPFIDEIILSDSHGQAMRRESDLIDVWFDSGAMPFAQWHYPFENHETFKNNFPADFIAEGVDQTRGWFFTLHAIAVLLEDSVAYKNVIANGLVLDKDGKKMSKRLGNAVDPFETMAKYGADALRWYMIENVPPWENLRFNMEHLLETFRKFFGTLYNTYSFFALYANIDSFAIDEQSVLPIEKRTELDRWILSKLYSTLEEVEKQFNDYEPTRAARAIQEFVVEELSNWYVRLSRRRFWKGEMTENKRAAYETLYECLMVTAQMMSPIAPFMSEWLYKNLSDCVRTQALEQQTPLKEISIHLTQWTANHPDTIDSRLEERMQWAQIVCSLVRSIRRKENIKVRTPLQKVMIPILDAETKEQLLLVEELIKSEINVKEIEYITADSGILVKKIKPNFRALGPKVGAKMKQVQNAIAELSQLSIAEMERKGNLDLIIDDFEINITLDEVEIVTQDMPGLSVASDGKITIALDIMLTEPLIQEGIARDLVNRIQNLRKDLDFDVTDRIFIEISEQNAWQKALYEFKDYICSETLANDLQIVAIDQMSTNATEIDIDENKAKLNIKKA